jgi:hypothetical protein
MDEATRAELERRTERWFVRQGLPHLIDRYSATADVFTRAAGFLYLVFILEVLNGLNVEWPWWANTLAFVGSLVILLGAVALLNRARGRPWYRRPDRIGPLELSAFVLLPALLPVLFGTQFGVGGVTVLVNVVILGITYVFVSYGILPMARWAVAHTYRQLRNLANVMIRTLPLLLVFSMFMFLNAELWNVVDEIPGSFFVISVGLLVGLGSVFLLLPLPQDVGAVTHFSSWREIDDLVRDTPVADVSVAGLAEPPDPPPPHRRARVNIGLLLYFGQATQVLLVALAIGGFYFVFGLFTVSESTIELWTAKDELRAIATWHLFGQDVTVTANLLRSSAFVAAIAGLQFVVSALRDETYRREFAEDVVGELHRVLAVRALYLARVVGGHGTDQVGAGQPSSTETAS